MAGECWSALWRQRAQQACAELQDEGSVYCIRRAIFVRIRVLWTRQLADQTGNELKDERSVDSVDLTVAVDVANQAYRRRSIRCRRARLRRVRRKHGR